MKKNLIRDRRLELGMTLKELADAVGVRDATVSRWETGDIANMKRDRIYKLAKALDISPLLLLGYDEPEQKSNIIKFHPQKFIPRLGPIACGTPILAQENIEEMVPLPDGVHADFALRCKGDSMVGARIYDGDLVYIRQQPVVENGEIAAVLIDDSATLKKFRRLEDRIILEPANPMMDPLVYRGEEMEKVMILGLAVAFTSAIR